MPRPIKNLKSLLAGRRMFANGGEVYGGPSGILASSQPLMESAGRQVMPQQRQGMPPWIGPRTPWGPQGGGGNVQGSVGQASGTLGTAQDQLRQAARQVGGIRNTLGPGGQQGGFPRPGPGWPGGLAGIFGNLGQQGMGGMTSNIFMKPAAPSPMPMAQGGVARLQDGGLPFRFSEDAMKRFKTPDPGYLESLTVKGPTPRRRLPPPGTGSISLDPTTPPLDRGGDAYEEGTLRPEGLDQGFDAPQGDPPMPEIMQTNLAQSITENYPGMPPEQIQEVISAKQNNPDVSIDEIIRVSYPPDVVASFSGQEAPPQAEEVQAAEVITDPEGNVISEADLKARVSEGVEINYPPLLTADAYENKRATQAEVEAVTGLSPDPPPDLIKALQDQEQYRQSPLGRGLGTFEPSQEPGGDTTIMDSLSGGEVQVRGSEKETIVPKDIKTTVAPAGTSAESPEDNAVIAVTDTTDQAKAPVLTRRSDLFAALTRRGPDAVNADGDVKATAVEDVVARGLKKGAGDDTIDIGKLKSDIEALMPAVKDDAGTEGLLLMMLGAAIGGGKSPDAWTNVFAGVEKALPSLINYRAKQTEAKRARQMGIAKMAITQKLSLEAEQRAETRGIRKEERGVARAIAAEERGVTRTIATEKRAAARKLLEINEYTTLKPHTVPASLFTEGAKGMITIPRMSFPLDSYGRQRMADWGISVVPVGKYTPKAADELASGRVKPIAELPLKQQNLLYQDPKPGDRIWEKFGSNFRPTYMTPKPAGVLSYGLKRRMAKEDFAAMHREYDTVRGNYGKLYDSLSELSKLDPKKLVGTGSIKERLGSAIAGLAGYNKNEKSFLNRWSNALLGDKDLSNIDLFETRGRILLARMAPIILGESGKTISDRDRVRVARSLGFEVDAITNDDGSVTFGQITGFNSKILANPETIRAAIQQTAGILSDRMEEMHKIYQRETDGIAVNIPDLELKEILGKRKVKPRLKFNLIAPIS